MTGTICPVTEGMADAALCQTQRAPRERGQRARTLSRCIGGLFVSTSASSEEWIALTIARDGSWGTASHVSQANAISSAITNCRMMAEHDSDCGSLRTTVKGVWSLALLCGTYNVLATGETLADATLSIRRRVSQLRSSYDQHMPQCQHIVTVQPNGVARGRLRPGFVTAGSSR